MSTNIESLPALLTIEQAAECLGLCAQTLRNQLSRGTCPIPTLKLGGQRRIRRIDVERIAYGDAAKSLQPETV